MRFLGNLALRCVQQRDHFLLQRGKVRCAVELAVNEIVFADQERGRQAQDTAKAVSNLEIAWHHGIVHLVLAIEIAQLTGVIFHGEADYLQSLVMIFLLQRDELRNFLRARRTPSRPEIYQHHFAPVIRRMQSGAVQINYGKVRSGAKSGNRSAMVAAGPAHAGVNSHGHSGYHENKNDLARHRLIPISPIHLWLRESPYPPSRRLSWWP